MSTHVARRLRKWARLAVWLLVLTPAAAHAQSTFTGVVKDATGAVLPGVTVEAASPVLIEKTRSVVTDASRRSHAWKSACSICSSCYTAARMLFIMHARKQSGHKWRQRPYYASAPAAAASNSNCLDCRCLP